MKEKILLLTLDRALKSVSLFKDELMIIKSYKFILKEGIKFLQININSLNVSAGADGITEKRLKKEKNKYTLNEKIFKSIVNLESILSKDEETKNLSNEYKGKFKEYKLIVKK